MSRMVVPSFENSPAASRPLLDGVRAQLGSVPNIFRLLGLSPAALEGFLGLSGGLSKSFDAATRERLAIAIAQLNGCDYCLSAHSYLAAKVAGLDEDEIQRSRRGGSADPTTDAALKFAVRVAVEKGRISDQALAEARRAGLTDAQLVELVGHVALNIFTNYLNNAAQTPVDFPTMEAEPV